MSRSSK